MGTFSVVLAGLNSNSKSHGLSPQLVKFQPFLASIREIVDQLRHLNDRQLAEYALQLRDNVQSGADLLSREVVTSGFGFAIDAIRRILGKELHEVQVLAGLVLAYGGIAEMATGEGKTLTAAAPAFLHALSGRGVHVMTSNSYLAERDRNELKPVYELLGQTTAVLPERASADEKRPLYDCDIVYGNGFEFGFDYLRDQIVLRQAKIAPLGMVIRRRLAGLFDPRITMQRGLNYVLVDEADHVMLDDAISPLLIAEGTPGEAPDAEAHRIARQVVDHFRESIDYDYHPALKRIQLTETGRNQSHIVLPQVPAGILIRPWELYVEAALKARLMFHRNMDYIIHEKEVQIVDGSTGRIMPDRTWSDGLHQAVLAKEGLPITPDTRSLARITRQRFLRLYKKLGGMTGTATGGEEEFQKIYRAGVTSIPLRFPSQRQLLPTRFFATAEAKWEAIVAEVEDRHATGQPVLVGTRSIAASEELAHRLRTRGRTFELLNGRQDRAEADIITLAGQLGAITIATNLAGRGTDIKPTSEALAAGGLFVIVSEPYESHRVDRQLMGRGARQGQPGGARVYASAQDELLIEHGRSLARRIQRQALPSGECPAPLHHELRSLQKATEQSASRLRQQLLKQDLQRDTILAKFLGEVR